jgi:hypothetical protein
VSQVLIANPCGELSPDTLSSGGRLTDPTCVIVFSFNESDSPEDGAICALPDVVTTPFDRAIDDVFSRYDGLLRRLAD